MHTENNNLSKLIAIIDEAKASNIITIDVAKQTNITDFMVICSGTSSRHVVAIAEKAMEQMKASGHPALRDAGLKTGEWVLVDFGDYILHVMLPETRTFYDLEGHWLNH